MKMSRRLTSSIFFRSFVFFMVFCALILASCQGVRADSSSIEITIDQTSVDGTNWMSGISDNRYIHEINIPGAHDSCTKNVWAAHIYTRAQKKYANTQDFTITELLDKGVRMLDLRFTNCQRNINHARNDDLFLCHGEYKKKAGSQWDALYYCTDNNGNVITFEGVMSDVQTWLKAHPTETVLLDVSSEFDDSDHNKKLPNVWTTLSKKLDNYNWLYRSDRIPQLKEVRGQAVILCGHSDKLGYKALDVGTGNDSKDITRNKTAFCYENHYDYNPDHKLGYVKDFYNKHSAYLSPDLISSLDQCPIYYFFSSSNNWKFSATAHTPKEIAKKVNPYLYGNSGLFTKHDGRKFGWVYSDYVNDSAHADKSYQACADYVWKSNFPSDKSADVSKYYHTITYKDDKGKTLGTQNVLTGAAAKLATIKSYDFAYWINAEDHSEIHQDTITPLKDMVLIASTNMGWKEFGTWIGNNASKSINYTFTEDLTASAADEHLVIPSGTTLRLNLNGHTIKAAGHQNIFDLDQGNAKLIINGPGSIEGGSISDYSANGGAIQVGNGSYVELNNVTVKGNSSVNSAGAVLVKHGGELSLNNTLITDNKGALGAVWVLNGAQLDVSGSTRIQENTQTGKKYMKYGDLFLDANVKVFLNGELTDEAHIDFAVNAKGRAVSDLVPYPTSDSDGSYHFPTFSAGAAGQSQDEIPVSAAAQTSSDPIVFTKGFGTWHDEPPASFFSCKNEGYVVRAKKKGGKIEAVITRHKHAYKVSAKGDHFTVTCTNDECYLGGPATIKLLAPEHARVGDGLSANATVVNYIADLEIDDSSFVYWEGNKKLKKAPTGAGQYKASITINGQTASVTYSIKKKARAAKGKEAEDQSYPDSFVRITKVKHTGNKIGLKWEPVIGAEGYDIFAAFCGREIPSKPTMTVKRNNAVLEKVYGKTRYCKVDASCIKYIIKAYITVNGKKKYVAASKPNHTVGPNHNLYSDARKVSTKKSSYTLKVGKTAYLDARVGTYNGQIQVAHTKAFRYVSTNKKVATVTSNGRIKAAGKGTCRIYVVCACGLTKTVKVTVK